MAQLLKREHPKDYEPDARNTQFTQKKLLFLIWPRPRFSIQLNVCSSEAKIFFQQVPSSLPILHGAKQFSGRDSTVWHFISACISKAYEKE